MDRERAEDNPILESPQRASERVCKKCGTPIQQGAGFCANCGANVPAAPINFDAIPDPWKKAAVGLLGVTVLGVLISAFWPSGESVPPPEPEPEAPPAVAETARPQPSRPPLPQPKRSRSPKKTEPSPTGEWNVRVESSPLDDIKTVFLDVHAMDTPEVKGTSSFAPQMSFMCTEDNVQGYVFVRSPPEVDRRAYATVRIRFDKEEPVTLRMEPSLKNDALFFDKPASVLKQMLGHEQMLFGYTPKGAKEVVTGFDIHGVDEAVKPLVEGCEVPELKPEEPSSQDASD